MMMMVYICMVLSVNVGEREREREREKERERRIHYFLHTYFLLTLILTVSLLQVVVRPISLFIYQMKKVAITINLNSRLGLLAKK